LKRLTLIILAVVAFMALFTGCSGAPADCPEMGIITNVEKPATSLNIDNRTGCSAPEFTWDTIDCQNLKPIAGKTQSLKDLRGRPVMIIFHKTMNCPGCKAQMPFIKAAYEQRTNKDLVVLTIYRGDSVSDVKRFAINQGYIFPALADTKDEFAAYCGFPVAAPITIFLDSNGSIKGEKIGPFQSQAEIEAVLNSL